MVEPRMDHLDSKLDKILEDLSEVKTTSALAVQKLDTHERVKEDHEQRIRILERWKMKIIGIATGAGASLSYVMNKLFGAAG